MENNNQSSESVKSTEEQTVSQAASIASLITKEQEMLAIFDYYEGQKRAMHAEFIDFLSWIREKNAEIKKATEELKQSAGGSSKTPDSAANNSNKEKNNNK